MESVRGVFDCVKQWAGAAVGKPCRLFTAHRAHRPPNCLVASPLRGGRRSGRRLNHVFYTVVALHNPSLSSFPAHLQDWRSVGFLLEGQPGLWTSFVVESLFSHLLLNAELVPAGGNVKAWSTGTCLIYILKILMMSAVEIRKEHPPSDSWLGLILGLL